MGLNTLRRSNFGRFQSLDKIRLGYALSLLIQKWHDLRMQINLVPAIFREWVGFILPFSIHHTTTPARSGDVRGL